MKSEMLVCLLLMVALMESVRCGMMDEMCPKTPCPDGKKCVGAGFLRMCEKPAKKGQRCSQESDKNKDGSYKGSPPCKEGLTCPNESTPRCE